MCFVDVDLLEFVPRLGIEHQFVIVVDACGSNNRHFLFDVLLYVTLASLFSFSLLISFDPFDGLLQLFVNFCFELFSRLFFEGVIFFPLFLLFLLVCEFNGFVVVISKLKKVREFFSATNFDVLADVVEILNLL